MKGLFSTQLRSSELPEQVLSRLSQQIGDDISWKNFISYSRQKSWFGHIEQSSFHIRATAKTWNFGALGVNFYGTVLPLPYQGGSKIEIKATLAKEIFIFQMLILISVLLCYDFQSFSIHLIIAYFISICIGFIIAYRYSIHRLKQSLNIFD